VKKNKKKIRVIIPWNTGQRIIKPKKGKGSFKRRSKFAPLFFPVESF